MLLHALIVDIFEEGIGNKYPVVRHIFYGKTAEEANGYFEAHRNTDTFLRGCDLNGQFRDFTCWTTVKKTTVRI